MSDADKKILNVFKSKSAFATLVVGFILALIVAFFTYMSIKIANNNEEHHMSVTVISHQGISNYVVTLNREVVDRSDNTYPIGTEFHVSTLYYNYRDNRPEFSLYYVPEGEDYSYDYRITTNVTYDDISPSVEFTSAVNSCKVATQERYEQKVRVVRHNTIVRTSITFIVFAVIMAFSFMLTSISDRRYASSLTYAFFSLCLLIAFIILITAPHPCR